MTRWKVEVFRNWQEHGEVEVEADDASDARDIVLDILSSGDGGIVWEGSNMTPEGEGVDCVTEVDDS